jgi:hypothetical protein
LPAQGVRFCRSIEVADRRIIGNLALLPDELDAAA